MAFSPLDLFASGEDGLWYDLSDLSTLWQDTSRTTPVTAAGQLTALVDDKTGHYNISNGTTTRQPTYQVDSGGRSNLFCNGANVLTNPARATGNIHTVAVIVQHSGSDSSGMAYDFTNGTSERAGFRDDSTGVSFGWYNGTFHTVSAPASTTIKVLLGTLDKTTGNVTLRQNGVDQTGSSVNLSTATNVGTFLGGRDPSAGAGYTGHIYQVVHVARALTTTERNNLENWLMTKAGLLVPSTTGSAKIWNGTAWVVKPVKVWNGTAWVKKVTKWWNGTAWKPTNY